MKGMIFVLCFCFLSITTFSQITITSADMPVNGDTLRYSIGNIIGSTINVYDSGTNKAWVFDTSMLRPIAQGRDDYKTADLVNATYALTIGLTDFGYKVADSVPGVGTLVPGMTIKDIYTFFKEQSSPSRFVASAFAASISGFPIPAKYSDVDEWYFFPLTYPHTTDSSTFAININLPNPLTGTPIGSLKRKGYRKTRVDGWGTIKTPYFTTPVSCIRVRSQIHEIDTINVPLLSLNLPLVLDSVEYKWLVNGEHYPALWVTTSAATGRITGVTYKDSLRHGLLNVPKASQTILEIKAYPNPTADGIVKLEVPAGWQKFEVWVYDVEGRITTHFSNEKEINISSLPAGQYSLLVYSNGNIGYTRITKQ